ncbi:protein kinase kinase kinase [Seminavis robusta]|uniref:Protein kinase kinase kinase n=1 Tax=Seminavis robusta TaxID=568900 RepID=A0A9N8EGG3_9STRA|nr:protein kinase kinase kinase [Seminavis robusta]|eukprot:Sro1090_g240130.1 protein kinase kinase kinase (565) ;mRNA; f:6272-7966
MKIFSRSHRSALKTVEDHGKDSSLQVTALVDKTRRASRLLQEEPPSENLAHFHREEISLGSVLRTGEFSTTYQVTQLPYYASAEPAPLGDASLTVRSSITALSLQRRRNHEDEQRRVVCGQSPQQYSFKHLNRKLIKQYHKQQQRSNSTRQFDVAATTLVLEAQYLARLDHENIVALRGVPMGEDYTRRIHEEFFLLTDRIVETLADRMDRWRAQEANRALRLDTASPAFLKKLDIARGILSALDYLQTEHNMVVLNLNPNSIGFNAEGTVQLFDLGHCREVVTWNDPPRGDVSQDEQSNINRAVSDDEVSVDDISVMLGSPVETAAAPAAATQPEASGTSQMGNHRKVLMTATTRAGVVPRYMAPELVTRGTFRLQSDSYSFALILFEMLTLSKPFATLKPGQHLIQVCIQGKRPNLTLYQFPTALDNLLQKGWKHNYSKRLKVSVMKQVMANMTFRRESTRTRKSKDPTKRSRQSKDASKSSPNKKPETERKLRRGRKPVDKPLPERQSSKSLSPRRDRKARATLRRQSEGNLLSMVSPTARKKSVQMATGRKHKHVVNALD